MKTNWTVLFLLSFYWLACDSSTTKNIVVAPLSASDSLALRNEAVVLEAAKETTTEGKDSLLISLADIYNRLRDDSAWYKIQVAIYAFYAGQNEYDLACQHLEQGLEYVWWEDDARIGFLNVLLGFAHRKTGRNYTASIYLEKARKLSERFKGVARNKNPAGPIHKTLGNIKTRLGDNDEAINIFESALGFLIADTAISQREKNLFTQGQVYGDMGDAYQNEGKEDYQKALDCYETGLAIFNKLSSSAKIDNEKGKVLANKAGVLTLLGRFEEANETVGRALATIRPGHSRYRFGAYRTQAEVLDSLALFNAATLSRQAALNLIGEPGIERREAAKLLNTIGWNAYQQKEYDIAVGYAQRALHEIYDTISVDDFSINPAFARMDPNPENAVAEALDLKSEALWQLHKISASDVPLALVESTTALAIQMMENLRDAVVYQSSKLNSSQQSRRLFSRMMHILYARHEAGDPRAIEQAFRYVEKSKAVLLQQKVTADDALKKAGVADTLISQKRILRDKQAYLKNKIFEQQMGANDSSFVAELNQDLYHVDVDIRQLDTLIADKYKLNLQTNEAYTATIADVQSQLLRDKETWIEYFTDADSSKLYQIAIEKNKVRFVRQSYDPAIVRSFIHDFNNARTARNKSADPVLFQKFTQTAHQLYQQLIGSVLEEGLPDYITIAPDGALALLPFDVLISKLPDDQNEAKYGALSYLLQNCILRIASSASLDLLYKDLAQAKHKGSYAGFAPDYASSSILEQVVSGTEVVQTAAKTFGGQAYVGSGADLESFFHKAADQAIIHFHGHAEALDSFPDYSWMAFTGSQPIAQAPDIEHEEHERKLLGGPINIPSQEIPHFLFAHQIYNTRLSADLVLLSACETGLGKIAPGEGTLSLSRAFQAAGCPATVMSLWEVKDDATAELMKLFLNNIRSGQDKDEALSNAKRTYLESAIDPFPYYWAGFVFTGKPDPVQFSNSFWTQSGWLFGIAFLLLAVVIAWVRRKKK